MLRGEPPQPIPPYQPAPVQISGVPDGYRGTRDVIAVMTDLVNGAYSDERINNLARQLTMKCAPRDSACEAAAILRYFQTAYRYTRLPNFAGLQRLQTPSYTLFAAPNGVKTGECASLSTAAATLLKSLGNDVSFRVGGQVASNPQQFEHVWLCVLVNGSWVPLDPSYDGGLGWEHPSVQTTEDFI